MPTVTRTIEDSSPLITYSANWWVGGLAEVNDEMTYIYSDGNFMFTNTTGDTVTFSFNGTGVQIFGAQRPNHGNYTVELDGSTPNGIDGSTSSPLFQQSLFSSPILQNGPHKVIITNQGSGNTSYLDVDFITWTTQIGEPEDNLIVSTIQDSDPSFMYSSSPSWNMNPDNVGSYLDGYGHAATDLGASFEFAFSGISNSAINDVSVKLFLSGLGVSLFGSIGPNGTVYTVMLDGGSQQTLNSQADIFRPQTMLYHAIDLPPGEHSVTVTCQSSSPGQVLTIDFANVYETNSSRSSTQSTQTGLAPSGMPSSAPGMSAGSSSRLSAGTIAGITIRSAAVLIALVALFFFYRHWRQARSNTTHGYSSASQTTSSDRQVTTNSGFLAAFQNSRVNFMPTPFLSIPPSNTINDQGHTGRPETMRERYLRKKTQDRPRNPREAVVSISNITLPPEYQSLVGGHVG